MNRSQNMLKRSSKKNEAEEMADHRDRLVHRLNKRNLLIDEAVNGQFCAVAKQIKQGENRVRMQVGRWLAAHPNYKPDCLNKSNTELSLRDFIKEQNWEEFLNSVSNGYGQGNIITLIALSNTLNVQIELFTSVGTGSADHVIINPEAPDQIIEESDGESEITDVEVARNPYFEKIDDDSFTPSNLLKNITSFTSTFDEKPIEHIEMQEIKPQVIKMYHYYKNYYGGVVELSDDSNFDDNIVTDDGSEFYADVDGPRMMSRFEPGMRVCYPAGYPTLNKFALGSSILTGVWWLVWLLFWGQDYSEFWSVLGFIIFYVAELINFVLGMVYMANFLFPVTRRWKSLHHLRPSFNLIPRADCMIFHYTEPIDTTCETLKGCLDLETHGKVRSDTYICDDGFWRKDPDAKPNQTKQLTKMQKLQKQIFSCEDLTKCCSILPCLNNKNKKNKTQYRDIDEQNSLVENDSSLLLSNNKVAHNHKSQRSFITEKKALKWIKENHHVIPTDLGRKLIRKIVATLTLYYTAQIGTSEGVVVSWNTRLTLLTKNGGGVDGFGAVTRTDCAVASLCYVFRVALPDDTPETFRNRAKVYLVARVKPPKHHYKAGNINNCIYNEMEFEDDRFLCFFDNDMRPHPAFLMRTVPFFFTFNGATRRYYHNKRVSFVQTPQYFLKDSLGVGDDFLASKNSIFFQAIQKGRDGFKSCAFAGTNAIFRSGALYAIGGMPYGSVTEDALAGRYLHKAGYRSIYAEEVLAVGEAPTTVASAMKQRMRWCKVK